MKDKVMIEGKETHLLDIMNPPGMFRGGIRLYQWTTKNLLPTSGKLIPEFDRRRNIRDMFSKKPSLLTSQSTNGTSAEEPAQSLADTTDSMVEQLKPGLSTDMLPSAPVASPSKTSIATKRSQKEASLPVAKRTKSVSQASTTVETSKAQKSLKGFFTPKTTPKPTPQSDGLDGTNDSQSTLSASAKNALSVAEKDEISDSATISQSSLKSTSPASPASQKYSGDSFIDPIKSKESWGKLFIKPAAPKCEHDEPCKTMLTKKSGINCGRSFWMCARPLGPSGNKEKGTQWRCSTFIWASDWNGAG